MCVALHMAPSEYWRLTTDEETALLKALEARNKQQMRR